MVQYSLLASTVTNMKIVVGAVLYSTVQLISKVGMQTVLLRFFQPCQPRGLGMQVHIALFFCGEPRYLSVAYWWFGQAI